MAARPAEKPAAHAQTVAMAPFPSTKKKKKKPQRRSLVCDHFSIHPESGTLRADPMVHHSPNLHRDAHDVFNLIVLVPVIALDLANWEFSASRPPRWHGRHFEPFWWTTVLYFVVDGLLVIRFPTSVRSPRVIAQHHAAVVAYVAVPYVVRRHAWIMGSCLLVEINTWLLIARRFFNRTGDRPFFFFTSSSSSALSASSGSSSSTTPSWSKSVRITLISVLFYVTWFAIRIVLYPVLFVVILDAYVAYTRELETPWNVLVVAPILHAAFIYLNFKWTYDLVRSKMRRAAAVRRHRLISSASSSSSDRRSTSGADTDGHPRDDDDDDAHDHHHHDKGL